MPTPASRPAVDLEALRGALSDVAARDVGPVEVVRAISTGFDSDIVLIRLGGVALAPPWNDELVLRIAPSPDRVAGARRESDLHAWLLARGFPVPRILLVCAPGAVAAGPVQVMTRAPGVSMLDAAKRRPWQVRELLDRFAALHVRLHSLPIDDIPTDADVLTHRLGLPRRVAETVGCSELDEGIRRVEALTERLQEAPPVLCHGDFHPLNALVDGASISIIDWTDGGLGDRHCDVARTLALFDIASIVAGSAVERRALEVVGPRLGASYLRRYQARHELDLDRVALWTPVQLLHDWSQALAGSDRDSSMPADLASGLAARFDAALEHVPPV